MVDQLSEGRLEIGFGRGASPIEAAYFGNDHAEAEATYRENLDRILAALSGGGRLLCNTGGSAHATRRPGDSRSCDTRPRVPTGAGTVQAHSTTSSYVCHYFIREALARSAESISNMSAPG